MSADPHPVLSESARAALLADDAVIGALNAFEDAEPGDRLDEAMGLCAAYSAYLARTPLTDVKPGALEEIAAVVKRAEDVIGELNDGKREWRMSIPARPDHDPDLLIHDALHRQTLVIRDLRICAASLQERIAAMGADRDAIQRECDDLHAEISAKVSALDFLIQRLHAENAMLRAHRDWSSRILRDVLLLDTECERPVIGGSHPDGLGGREYLSCEECEACMRAGWADDVLRRFTEKIVPVAARTPLTSEDQRLREELQGKREQDAAYADGLFKDVARLRAENAALTKRVEDAEHCCPEPRCLRCEELRMEVEQLRRFGNKDCTAMADDELDELRAARTPPVPEDTTQGKKP